MGLQEINGRVYRDAEKAGQPSPKWIATRRDANYQAHIFSFDSSELQCRFQYEREGLFAFLLFGVVLEAPGSREAVEADFPVLGFEPAHDVILDTLQDHGFTDKDIVSTRYRLNQYIPDANGSARLGISVEVGCEKEDE